MTNEERQIANALPSGGETRRMRHAFLLVLSSDHSERTLSDEIRSNLESVGATVHTVHAVPDTTGLDLANALQTAAPLSTTLRQQALDLEGAIARAVTATTRLQPTKGGHDAR